jgi:hypothetical protein
VSNVGHVAVPLFCAAASLHTDRVRRLEIGVEQRHYQLIKKQLTGFGGSSYEIGLRLTPAKRLEQAALRELAKLCANVRCHQVDDANVIDVPILLTTTFK